MEETRQKWKWQQLSKEKEKVYCEEGMELLGAAVINRAVKDYQYALKVLRRKPNDIQARRMATDCESFFRKEIELYSDLDGESIIKKVREMVSKGRL